MTFQGVCAYEVYSESFLNFYLKYVLIDNIKISAFGQKQNR